VKARYERKSLIITCNQPFSECDQVFPDPAVTVAAIENRISSAVFSPDGTLVATGSLDGSARIWSTNDGHVVDVIKGHGDVLTDLAFSPDSKLLLTASRDGTATLGRDRAHERLLTTRGYAMSASALYAREGRPLRPAGGRPNYISLPRPSGRQGRRRPRLRRAQRAAPRCMALKSTRRRAQRQEAPRR
jgi:hypothetical protein